MLLNTLSNVSKIFVALEYFADFLSSLNLEVKILDTSLIVSNLLLSVYFLFNCHGQMAHLGQSFEEREEVQVSFDVLFTAHLLSDVAAIRALATAHSLHHHFDDFLLEGQVVCLADIQLEVVCIHEVCSTLSYVGCFRISSEEFSQRVEHKSCYDVC